MSAKDVFREQNWSSVPIRDLKLAIEGTRLEPVLAEFQLEVAALQLRVTPRFYLSTDWGVVTGTVAVAIPFYLAHPELAELHAQKTGHIEGENRKALLRYLRHELGHVVNYAYRLYDEGEWVRLFGTMTQPYLEEYRPSPFSRRYVRHLPGWYAQKHPDEDWAETFAVWMTPGSTWRTDYADQPMALAKLEYCERTLIELRERDPIVDAAETEEDVGELPYSVEQYYGRETAPRDEFPPGLDGALRAIFDELDEAVAAEVTTSKPASALIRGAERDLMADVYRWTGHFPERTRALLRHLSERADALALTFDSGQEHDATMALTTFVTALAMNHVHQGTYQARD
jgi:hypothetical protein